MTQVKPYASWSSNLTAELLAKKGRRFGHIALDQGVVYWLESRAEEQGRGVLMCCDSANRVQEVLPSNISVRTKVHEMGGADFFVVKGKVYFSSADDNRIYCFSQGKISAVTQLEAGQESRYADFQLTHCGTYLIAVRETHQAHNVVNELISINLTTFNINLIHGGFDFYSFPRISPKGDQLCWTCWNHPDMPWDGAELWLADLHRDARTDAAHKVSGGNGNAIFQPAWSNDGVLHYINDVSNWSNIYSHRDGVLNALTPIDRDFATPQWLLGLATYVINSDNSLYALNFELGEQHLSHIDTSTGHIEPIKLPLTQFFGGLLADEKSLYFCAASPLSEMAMYRFDLASQTLIQLTELTEFPLGEQDISVAQAIRFPVVASQTKASSTTTEHYCHAFYYAPKNSQYHAPKNTLPPLIVISHGGPTASTDNCLNPSIQFWTNRGFAVVDVNYAGSTGYGKRYRDLLLGNWGIVDVQDCIAAAQFLVAQKWVDAQQLLIRGGSAGGFTTLCALTFHDVFAAGMSRYGIADLEMLATDTHKFEARYLDKLVGAYPQNKSIYRERSPIHFTEQLSCPILLLQGADDKVVPPNQAEQMVLALEAKKLPYSYLLFEGEGHGFRKADTLIKAFNAELSFYRQILGVDSDEPIDTLAINNR